MLSDILESVGVRNMTQDESDENEESSDIDFGVDWIQKVLSNNFQRPDIRSSSPHPKKKQKKRRRRWKCRTKLPYTSSMFYRDFHNPCCRTPDTKDYKEFRLNYRMPWTETNKLVRMFVTNKWVITQEECDKRRVKGQKVCPPEIKILGTLYWLGEGCSFRTIYNLSGRVLCPGSFRHFAKKFCSLVQKQLGPKYIKTPGSVEDLLKISKVYEERGFPGACGSTDGVQIAWEGCPYTYRASFTGKEKVHSHTPFPVPYINTPILLYNVIQPCITVVPHTGVQRDRGPRIQDTTRLFHVRR